MRKPVFNLFWLLLCVCSIWGCGVRPGEKTPQNQTQEMLSYEIVDAEVTITHCNEAADGDLEIPAEIAGLPVTSIGEAAFRSSLLTSITIPDSVTSIGTGACAGCVSLNSVTIPGSVTSIGKGAFVNCSRLTSITIPDGVISIEDWAFHRCSSLASVTIPDSVTTIGDFAFANCFGLKSVTIPQAFHSKDEASRLKLDKLWPNDFSLPVGTSK